MASEENSNVSKIDEEPEHVFPCEDRRLKTNSECSQSGQKYPLERKTSKVRLIDAEKNDKRISKYYKKQNELLENFKNDSDQIEAFKRVASRKRVHSMNHASPSMSSTDDLKRSRLSSEHHGNVENGKLSQSQKEKGKNGSASTLPSRDSLVIRHEEAAEKEKQNNIAAERLSRISFLINFLLMIAKVTAAVLSGSMSIISSMVDSIVDITTGGVLSISSRLIAKRDPYSYPRGRTRLEPISLILISVIMGMASVQLIITSIKRIYEAYMAEVYKIGEVPSLEVSWITIGIMLTTIAVKLCLLIVCQKYKNNSTISTLAMDHRNDCISNTVAILCGWLGARYWYYLDPIGAIVVSIYILYTWVRTGREQMIMLSGKSAKPEFINRIIKVCIDHDKRITHLDTVYVYHYGHKFLVEVHIVLDKTMQLRETHDIAESLQSNIESLPEVERAFVHTDYDFHHHPEDEHKIV